MNSLATIYDIQLTDNQCSTGMRPEGSGTRSPRPRDRGTPGKTFPPPVPHPEIFVFPLFLLFTIPAWYYFKNKSIDLVFTWHNHEYTSNELLFLRFLFYFYNFRDIPLSSMNFPKIWRCLHKSLMYAPLLPCPGNLGEHC